QIVWTADRNGVIAEDSPSWRAFTGQSYEEWKNAGWIEALHPDDRDFTLERWQEAITHRRLYEVEYRLRHVTGQWRWTLARGVPHIDENGELRGWVGMNTDIHDQKLAEEQRQE